MPGTSKQRQRSHFSSRSTSTHQLNCQCLSGWLQGKMGWCNRLKGIGRQKPDTCLTQGLPSLCGSALQEVGDEHQDQDLPSSTIGCLFGDHERLLGLRVENEFGSSPPLLEIWVWSVLSSLRASVPDQC